MEDLFIPYDLALELKELGFEEECLGWYNYGKLNIFREDNLLDGYAGEESRPLAPLYQQSFKFFREKCKSKFILSDDYYWITGIGQIEVNSYEEAELECLKRLIKIVKDETI